jgi:4-oxalocrotonate tautomerase
MPSATIEGPEINDVEVKRDLTRKITDALEEAYNLPRQAYVVLIKENKPENISTGGELLIDKKKQKM